MTLDYILGGGAVPLGLSARSHWRDRRNSEACHDFQRLGADRALRRRGAAADAAPGRLSRQCHGGPSVRSCRPSWRRSSAASIGSPASIRAEEQSWWVYARAMLVFHVVGFVFLYVLLRLQSLLPLNPQDMAAVPPDLAFNTAISFVTNTNWQAYGGESTMSYLSQMAGLAVQNFVSARRRHRARHGADPRLCPCRRQGLSATSGPISCASMLYVLLPVSHRPCPVLRLAGRAAEPRRLCRGDDARGRQADHRPGPGGFAARDQDAGHQRRRLLQRQLRASLREPDGALQSRRRC